MVALTGEEGGLGSIMYDTCLGARIITWKEVAGKSFLLRAELTYCLHEWQVCHEEVKQRCEG